MIRTVELGNYLVSQGHDVSVVALKRQQTRGTLLQVDPRIRTFFARDVFFRSNPLTVVSAVPKLLAKLMLKVFQGAFIDEDHLILGLYKNSIWEAYNTIKPETIVISSPPCSLRLLSEWCKREFSQQVQIIGDYRDSWTLRDMYIRNLSSRALRKRRAVEQRTLLSNDLTVFVSTGMLRQYRETFRLGDALVVENGFVERQKENIVPDESITELRSRQEDPHSLILGYFGSGSVDGTGHKDFRNLLDIIHKDVELRNRITVIVAGRVSGLEHYKGAVEVMDFGVVPNRQVFSLLASIDVGLVVHSETLEAPAVMGGKLYDYVGASKAIWFIVPPNAESIKHFVYTHNKSYLCDIFCSEEIERTLRTILEDKKQQRVSEQALTANERSKYRRTAQFSRLLPYIS